MEAWAYLRDVFTRLRSLPPESLDKLLPDAWLAAHPRRRWRIEGAAAETPVNDVRFSERSLVLRLPVEPNLRQLALHAATAQRSGHNRPKPQCSQ